MLSRRLLRVLLEAWVVLTELFSLRKPYMMTGLIAGISEMQPGHRRGRKDKKKNISPPSVHNSKWSRLSLVERNVMSQSVRCLMSYQHQSVIGGII